MHLSSLLNIVSRSTQRSDCHHRLHAAVVDLTQLTLGTEGDFLAIGEKLRDFYSQTKEVSNLSASITEKMVGAEVTEAMEELQGTFDRIGRLDGESGRGRDALTSILERFSEVRSHLQGFEKTVRNLHVLCNFIKIESARSGRKDTGFETLSDDVKKLAENIESQSALLLDQSAVLTSLINQNLEKFRRFEDHQHQQASHILNDAVTNLAAIREKHGHSSLALKTLSTRWDELSRNIAEVVSSMQFHDITRQQIEHVRDALNELTGQHRAPGAGESGKKRKSIGGMDEGRAALVADTCELQAAQLRNARDELVSAVRTIIENTRNIVRNVEEMTEEMKRLVGVSGSGGSSFFAGLEGGLTSLISAVSDYVSVNRELSAALHRVTGTVEQMSSFVNEIEKIGLKMKMVALNAAVHAARIGEEGLGLGVLADALHPLSVETSLQIGAIAGDLNTIISISKELSDNLSGDAAAPQEDTERMSDHLKAMMAPLHCIDENNLSLLAGINGIVKGLSEDVEKTTTAISIHTKIDQEVNRLDAELMAIVAEMRSALPAGESGSAGQHLRGLSARYTMDKEREIHQSVATRANPKAGTADQDPLKQRMAVDDGRKAVESSLAKPEPMNTGQVGPEKTEQENLGDNVELF
jgi:methyl-accepting chemotaxis protein